MATNSQGTFIDLNANRGPQIIRVAVALLIVSTLAVICRLIARRLKKVKLIASDYTLLLALLGVWLADVNAIVGKLLSFLNSYCFPPCRLGLMIPYFLRGPLWVRQAYRGR